MFSPLSGIFPANFDPGQPWSGQAGLAARPRLPRFFYPLASPAKDRPLAVLTPAFRLGFDPGLPRSGQAPDARVSGTFQVFLFLKESPCVFFQPPSSILAQVQLLNPVPIHAISFNCADTEANQFLCQLAAETGGR